MLMALTSGKLLAGSVGIAIATFGAFETDKWLALAGAFVSIGSVMIPTIIEWYHRSKEAQRLEYEETVALNSRLFALEVQRRAELEVQIKDLQEKFDALKCPLGEAGRQKCILPHSPEESNS